jgi:hypothetical protein
MIRTVQILWFIDPLNLKILIGILDVSVVKNSSVSPIVIKAALLCCGFAIAFIALLFYNMVAGRVVL